MTAEGLLHIGGRRTAAGLAPERPGLAQQCAEDDAVDIAAAIAAHIDDQAWFVIMLIEVAGKAGEVPGRHGAQV